MEPVVLIWLLLIGTWFYSACSLIYIPVRVLILILKGKDVWSFLSRRRLLLSALAYLVSAPLVGLFAFLVSAGSASGGHTLGISDDTETLAYWLAGIFLTAAGVAFMLLFVRPKPSAE